MGWNVIFQISNYTSFKEINIFQLVNWTLSIVVLISYTMLWEQIRKENKK